MLNVRHIKSRRDAVARITPEREIINAGPTASPVAPPERALILAAVREGLGAVRLAYAAAAATSYDVRHRELGAEEFQLVGDDVIERTFLVTGLAPGKTHEFTVRPRNARGEGPESEIFSLALPAT